MNVKHPFLQTVILIAGALVVAIVANGFASRQRRLVLPGHYPNALVVPESTPEPPPIAALPAQTQTTDTTGTLVEMAATDTMATTATVAPVATATTTAATTTTATTPTATAATTTAPHVTPPPPVKLAADPVAHFAPHPDKAYVEIGGDDVALLYKSGVLFLDARRTSVFEEGHIAGSRSFPIWESDIDDRVNALFSERSEPADQNKPIVIYCSGGACEDSHMLAQKLWAIQFNNVYVYKDGFPDWQKRGGAVRTGGAS